MDEETTQVIDVNQNQSDNELESGELEDSSGKSSTINLASISIL